MSVQEIDDNENLSPNDSRLTDLPVAAVERRLRESGDTEAAEVIQHLRYVIWEQVRYEDSYGVPNSSWDCCGICERAEAGPGKFATGVDHHEKCPLHKWMD